MGGWTVVGSEDCAGSEVDRCVSTPTRGMNFPSLEDDAWEWRDTPKIKLPSGGGTILRRLKSETNGLRRLTADQFRPRGPGRFRDRVIVRVSGRRHLQYGRALTRC